MKSTRVVGGLASLALSAMLAGNATAAPVSYEGAIFNLSIVDVGAPGGTYQATYTADFTNFTNAIQQPFIKAVSWKHAGEDVASVSLLSAPGSGWASYADSVVTANGCSGSGGNTWACAQDNTSPYVATSGLLSWVFSVSFTDSLIERLNTTGDSIKAMFVDANGRKKGALLSCTLNDNPRDNCSSVRVPEPSPALLMALGLMAVGLARATRSRKRSLVQSAV